jgi:hypothetical protein
VKFKLKKADEPKPDPNEIIIKSKSAGDEGDGTKYWVKITRRGASEYTEFGLTFSVSKETFESVKVGAVVSFEV